MYPIKVRVSQGLRSVVQSDNKRVVLETVPDQERQQEQGSRTKHSRKTCSSERRPDFV